MPRLLHLLGVGALVGACGTTSRAFERHYVVAICGRLEVCQTWDRIEDSREQCVEQELRDRRHLIFDAEGFDRRQAEKCIRAIYDADCDEGLVPSVCETVYED